VWESRGERNGVSPSEIVIVNLTKGTQNALLWFSAAGRIRFDDRSNAIRPMPPSRMLNRETRVNFIGIFADEREPAGLGLSCCARNMRQVLVRRMCITCIVYDSMQFLRRGKVQYDAL